MKKLFVLFLILFSCCAFAQVPEPAMRWLNGCGGNDFDAIGSPVTKTSDGGFIIGIGTNSAAGTGNIDSFCNISGNRNIFIKYNSDATILEWSKCFSYGSGDTGFIYLFPQNDGGNILGGEYLSGSGWGFYLCKQDGLGNIVWSHGYSKGNGPLLRDMITTKDGGYIMAGEVYYADTNFTKHYGASMSSDIGVLKLDSLGNKVWCRVIGGTGDEYVTKVISGTNGRFYIEGTTASNDSDCTGNHGGNDVYLACLDSNGNILWHRDIGGSNDEGGDYACEDGKGGIIISATTTSMNGDVHHYAGGGSDYYVLEVDSSNNILWDNCFGGAGSPYAVSICKAIDGSIWINGLSNGKGGEIDTVYDVLNGDAWLVHTDSIGNFINAKVLGSIGYDKGNMVYPLSNGNVIAGGFYSGGNGAFDSLVFYGGSNAFLAVFAATTTEVKKINAPNNFVSIYPNPTCRQVTIKENQKSNCQIIITNVLGEIIYQTSFIYLINIAVNEWTKGLYYVQLKDEYGYRCVQKLLVQ